MMMPCDGWACLAALAAGALLLPVGPLRGEEGRRPPRPLRAALFRAAGFPTVDAPALASSSLDEALAGLPVEAIEGPRALADRLRIEDTASSCCPTGARFPVEAWPAIRAFIGSGGGLVVFGGAPFQQPVR